ncbi:terpene synthase 10-like [Senna tora]|uniref:Terpene synthase 10-like n=1 Tax=Senna tora TaxID=362788 RepID=A0A835CCC6_9FABA|nr:terpene synthase 10-like [Senna tora]
MNERKPIEAVESDMNDVLNVRGPSDFHEESNAEKWQVLKEEVRMMLCKKKEEEEPLHQLEFIDVLQRLGVAYHFETEIKNILENHYININKMDKLLKADIKGMLSLYEASFLEVENESILKKAREFSREILKEYYVRKEKENDFMSLLINHALEVPLHWRMQRWEALWFINAYERSPNVIPPLLQLAKLDFNMLQAIYQEELKHTSRWWKGIGLMENLSFARDRLVEGFVWAVGYNYMPQNAKLRKVITKVLALITTMDDIYDVYGTLEELELFTQAWAELSKAYLIEAKWYYSGYKPKLQEYMENAWISMGPNVVLVHAYFCVQHPIRKEDLDRFEEHPLLCRYSGIIFRLADDLETFKDEMKRGDVPKAIECYMNEYEGSEEDGREHIKSMMDETWKKMNEEIIEKCSFN